MTRLLQLALITALSQCIITLENKVHPDPVVESLLKSVKMLTRQVLLQQLYMEESARNSGHSGIKQIRVSGGGSRPYYSRHHTGYSMASMHDHANYKHLVGLGELVAVMNGVEFRTRHNDYTLRMPHKTKTDYHLTEGLPFPEVPKEVLAKRTTQEQIEEMREWFKAFAEEDASQRDYKKYFKPVLCYLEGAWTKTDEKIDPPFESDRHHVEADTWQQMQEQTRFSAYTGRKNQRENFLFLPNKVVGINNDSSPILAQWNYRILCHPLKEYISPSVLKPIDDLASRFTFKRSMAHHERERGARFKLFDYDSEDEQFEEYSLLDELMAEIPGLDNYPGDITDDSFDLPALDFMKDNTVLNSARYHRYYKVGVKGGSGKVKRLRGFSDDTLFVAFNTRDKIYGPSLRDCSWDSFGVKQCKTIKKKVSYALPLEIVYLNPLMSWNPYNITYKGSEKSNDGKTVVKDGRDGSLTLAKAFNGTNSANYYLTPVEFFSGEPKWGDDADTGGVKAVLPSGKADVFAKVASSGVKIFLPPISEIGVLRMRYPILPVYGEGSGAWKELEALKDAVMERKKYKWLYREEAEQSYCWDQWELSLSTTPEDRHKHELWISNKENDRLENGETVGKETSLNSGHKHGVDVKKGGQGYEIVRCDGRLDMCWDGHNKTLKLVKKYCY